jgi:hypothetical protein
MLLGTGLPICFVKKESPPINACEQQVGSRVAQICFSAASTILAAMPHSTPVQAFCLVSYVSIVFFPLI